MRVYANVTIESNVIVYVFYRMSLPDLPPLPKSLSGLEVTGVPVHNSAAANLAAFDTKRGIAPLTRMTASQSGSNTTTSTLDTQLAVLRREMVSIFSRFSTCGLYDTSCGRLQEISNCEHECLQEASSHVIIDFDSDVLSVFCGYPIKLI